MSRAVRTGAAFMLYRIQSATDVEARSTLRSMVRRACCDDHERTTDFADRVSSLTLIAFAWYLRKEVSFHYLACGK